MPNNQEYIQDPVFREAALSGEIARGKAKNAGKSEAEQEQAAALARKSYVDAYDIELKDRKHLTEDEKDAYAKAYANARVEGKSGKEARAEGNKAAKKRRKERPEENRRKQEFEQQQIQLAASVNAANMGMSTVDAQDMNMTPIRESQLIGKTIHISLVYSICSKDKLLPANEEYERVANDLNNKVDLLRLFPICNFADEYGNQSSPNSDEAAYLFIDCSSLSMRDLVYELVVNEKLKKKLVEGVDAVFRQYMSMSDMLKTDCKLYLTIVANEVIRDLAYATIYAVFGSSAYNSFNFHIEHKSLLKYIEKTYLYDNFSEIRNRGNILNLYYVGKIDWGNTWVQLAQSQILKIQSQKGKSTYQKVSTAIHFVLGIASALVPHPAVKGILFLTDLLYYEIEAIVFFKLGDKRAAVDSFKGFEFSVAFFLLPLPYKGAKKIISKLKPKALVKAGEGTAKTASPKNVLFKQAALFQREMQGLGFAVNEIKESQKTILYKRMFAFTQLEELQAQKAAMMKQAEAVAAKRAQINAMAESTEEALKKIEKRMLNFENQQLNEASQKELMDLLKEYQHYKNLQVMADVAKKDFTKLHPEIPAVATSPGNYAMIDAQINNVKSAILVYTFQIAMQEIALRLITKTVTFSVLRNRSLQAVEELCKSIKETGKAVLKDSAYDLSGVFIANVDNILDSPLIFVDLDEEDRVENLKNGRELMAYATWELKEDMYHLMNYVAGAAHTGIPVNKQESNKTNASSDSTNNPDFVWDINGA